MSIRNCTTFKNVSRTSQRTNRKKKKRKKCYLLLVTTLSKITSTETTFTLTVTLEITQDSGKQVRSSAERKIEELLAIPQLGINRIAAEWPALLSILAHIVPGPARDYPAKVLFVGLARRSAAADFVPIWDEPREATGKTGNRKLLRGRNRVHLRGSVLSFFRYCSSKFLTFMLLINLFLLFFSFFTVCNYFTLCSTHFLFRDIFSTSTANFYENSYSSELK